MKAYQVVWVLLLASEAMSLSLPGMGILSSLTSSKKSDEDQQELKEQQEKHPTTHRPTRPPLIPAIPHPADTPLNPYNNPNHPLHPDNLPHLPSLHLPALPHHHRETIHATKTVYVEVTDRMTIHPVCMTAHKVTPPCLPYDPHYHHHYSHPKEDVQDKREAPVIKPTAVIELEVSHNGRKRRPTRILGAVSISDPLPAEIPVEEPAAEEARSARYVELTPSLDAPEKVEIKDAPAEHPAGGHVTSPLDVVHNLIHPPVTHYKTKTLLVTKVEKVLDTRVTATLIAENCIPTNSHIPLCAPHGGLVGPGYHGYQSHGDGVFSETYGGHVVAGYHTEKQPEDGLHAEEQQAKEEVLEEDNEAEEEDTQE